MRDIRPEDPFPEVSVTITRDSQSKMADSSFTSISYGNDEYEHVVRVLFENDQQAIAVFKEKKIVTIEEALDFCSQHNLFNSLKWKSKNNATWKEVDD